MMQIEQVVMGKCCVLPIRIKMQAFTFSRFTIKLCFVTN